MIRIAPLILILGLLAPLRAADGPPNILFFYADDMGWGSIGPNGQDDRRTAGLPHVLVPNLDSLAAAGVNFTRAYGCTVCSPARSSQQSGFHQGHTYADRNNTDNARKAMRADDRLMGDVLAEAGYATGYWGKWGYGSSDSQSNPKILNLQTLPTSHGYQHVLAELHHVRAHTFFQPTLWKAPATPGALGGLELVPNSMAAFANNANYPETPAYQSDPSYPSTGYCDDAYCFAALDFVRAQAQVYNSAGQPFFGLLAVQVPHSPYDEISQLPNWDAAYSGNAPFATLSNEAKQWAAMVTRIDAHFGNILAALEDPNNDGDTNDSVADNTLVIFMSDNGGPSNSARSQLNANGGLRDSKGSIYEGGIRVPVLVRWPARITSTSTLQAGTSSSQVIDVSDLLPTFCDLAGVETPLGIDGVSIAPTLTGNGQQRQRRRDHLIHEAQPNYSIIRRNMKLIGPGNALYDLAADPDESDNIAGSHPALVAELSAIALAESVTEPAWFANTYHQWTGSDGDATSDAAHWSDYEYRNALNNIVYQTDNGPPQASWIARMENSGSAPATATVDANLEVLGLEVSGASDTATQTLDLGSLTLSARNELRLSAHARLKLNNGTIQSQRWIDLLEDATLTGAGMLVASLYHSGSLELRQASGTNQPGPDIIVPGPDIPITDGHQFISNGGFENGTDSGGGDYSYDTLVDWFTDGPDSTKDGAKPDNAHTGTMRGLVQDGYPLVQSTGFPFLLGDSYTLSFQHRGFFQWATGETAIVRVFYEDGGVRTNVFTASFPLTFGAWKGANYPIPAITDHNADGKILWVSLGPDAGTGFASFDEVSLIRHGPATTFPGPGTTIPGPDIIVPGHRRMEISGDYHAFDNAVLDVAVAGATSPGEDHGLLEVSGKATLGGVLSITVDPGYTPAHGDTLTIVTADSLIGTFSNPDNSVTGSDGTTFNIAYTAGSVTLTVDAKTAQGTPYSWLEFHRIDGGDHEAADLIDHDGDGMLAWEEYLAGTIPTDPTSFFAASVSTKSGSLELRWPSSSGRIYHVLDSADLVTPFDPFAGPLPATPPENVLSIPGGASRQFFRIQVEFE